MHNHGDFKLKKMKKKKKENKTTHAKSLLSCVVV
jgi:hypothetical protein